MSGRVLVLGGGPDAEREVSLQSAANIGTALRAAGFEVNAQTIGRISPGELRELSGDVIFPVLHGAFGEGGPLQDMLEADGRPYVGCGPDAARMAMDKMATKLAAARAGVPTPEAAVFNPRDDRPPLAPPLVLKPVHDGSSVGLHIVKDYSEWEKARAAAGADIGANPGRAYMVERYAAGAELTVGVLDGRALPIINIVPAEGAYDYEAKYQREDTAYIVDPPLSGGVGERVTADALRLSRAIGVRHIARVDFILDGEGRHWLLEINTMPGCTSHSLVPMAARRIGLEMPRLCAELVQMAVRDGR